MERIKQIFPFFSLSLIVLFFITTACEEFQSEEFQISDLDSKACIQLQREDSLGADTVKIKLLSKFDSTWVDSNLYDEQTKTYSNVPEILDSLNANQIVVTKTPTNKIKLVTVGAADTNYVSLQATSSSLTFFFDTSVSINIISQAGDIIRVSDETMPLETASGCTIEDDNEIQVPYIKARYKISMPSSDDNSLLQIIKNEQTKSSTFHVAIL